MDEILDSYLSNQVELDKDCFDSLWLDCNEEVHKKFSNRQVEKVDGKIINDLGNTKTENVKKNKKKRGRPRSEQITESAVKQRRDVSLQINEPMLLFCWSE